MYQLTFDIDDAADSTDCLRPDLMPLTAYRYGCRCARCSEHKQASAAGRDRPPVNRPCRYDGCSSDRRRVQGAKYCERHATSTRQPTGHTYQSCVLCGQLASRTVGYRNMRVCFNCATPVLGLLRSASLHHVDIETLRRWTTDKRCALCGQGFYLGKTWSKQRDSFSVDHDHGCCPGEKSCGQCVRGLVCNRCNMQIGQVESLIRRSGLPQILAYLQLDT